MATLLTERRDESMRRGDTWTRRFKLNLGGGTLADVRFAIRRPSGDQLYYDIKQSTHPTQFSVVGDEVDVTIPAGDAAGLAAGRYWYDVERTTTTPNNVLTTEGGALTISQDQAFDSASPPVVPPGSTLVATDVDLTNDVMVVGAGGNKVKAGPAGTVAYAGDNVSIFTNDPPYAKAQGALETDRLIVGDGQSALKVAANGTANQVWSMLTATTQGWATSDFNPADYYQKSDFVAAPVAAEPLKADGAGGITFRSMTVAGASAVNTKLLIAPTGGNQWDFTGGDSAYNNQNLTIRYNNSVLFRFQAATFGVFLTRMSIAQDSLPDSQLDIAPSNASMAQIYLRPGAEVLSPIAGKIWHFSEALSAHFDSISMFRATSTDTGTQAFRMRTIWGDSTHATRWSRTIFYTIDATEERAALELRSTGTQGLVIPALPTSDPGVSGAIWNDAGTVKVSP